MGDGRDPFEDLANLLDQLTDLTGVESAGGPPVDLVDRPDEFLVAVDLPGYEVDDIEVRISGQTLRIRADREIDLTETGDTLVRQERRRETAERSVDLPAAVEEESVSADLSDGVLEVTLPKATPDEGAVEVDIE